MYWALVGNVMNENDKAQILELVEKVRLVDSSSTPMFVLLEEPTEKQKEEIKRMRATYTVISPKFEGSGFYIDRNQLFIIPSSLGMIDGREEI